MRQTDCRFYLCWLAHAGDHYAHRLETRMARGFVELNAVHYYD